MAFVQTTGVEIKGVACAVPKQIKVAKNQPFFTEVEAENFTNVTGVVSSHVAPPDMALSDLCQAAAQELLHNAGWDSSTIDLLIFVSTSRDFYICPNTANILQHKLGLSTKCVAIDLPFACSGYVYGLSVASSLMQTGQLKRALLLVGEMTSKNQSSLDKTVWSLHGDAGSATLLEYNPEFNFPMQFNLGGDGSGWEAIICREIGVRYMTTEESLKYKKYEEGVERNATQCAMDGMSVFSFAISRPGQSINELCNHYNIDVQNIDYLLIHQANKMIDEKIRRKLKLPSEKVPYSMQNYGNTSSCTIPITMVSEIREELCNSVKELILCGFGSGLSWGAAHIYTDKITCLPIIEI
ncbi:MAG: ketoacyl-ACP synthase III [Bacteroidales bacterium]|nr:ketoacyl-ACP synthase III [Bacteroidales bacterium]